MLSAHLHDQLSVAVAVRENTSDVCLTSWDLCVLISKCTLDCTLPLKVLFLIIVFILRGIWIAL